MVLIFIYLFISYPSEAGKRVSHRVYVVYAGMEPMTFKVFFSLLEWYTRCHQNTETGMYYVEACKQASFPWQVALLLVELKSRPMLLLS